MKELDGENYHWDLSKLRLMMMMMIYITKLYMGLIEFVMNTDKK